MRQKTDFSAMRRKLDDALLALAAYRETKAILNLDKAPAGAVLLRLVDNLKKIFLLDRVPAKKLAVVALTDPNATISLPVLKIYHQRARKGEIDYLLKATIERVSVLTEGRLKVSAQSLDAEFRGLRTGTHQTELRASMEAVRRMVAAVGLEWSPRSHIGQAKLMIFLAKTTIDNMEHTPMLVKHGTFQTPRRVAKGKEPQEQDDGRRDGRGIRGGR